MDYQINLIFINLFFQIKANNLVIKFKCYNCLKYIVFNLFLLILLKFSKFRSTPILFFSANLGKLIKGNYFYYMLI